MLRKFGSSCFALVVFSGMFFASQSAGYGQSSMDFGDIVQSYQASRFTIPTSEIQYHEILGRENGRYGNALENLKEIYLLEDSNILQAKTECRRNKKCLEYLNSENEQLADDYVKALDRVKNIYGNRRRQLNEARKNFKPLEMRIDDSIHRRRRYQRIYEQRIDDSIITPDRNRRRR